MVAGSVWGCHRTHRELGFCETWHTTAGKLEHTALVHNDTVLLLDETKLAGDTDKKRGQTVIDVTFRLAEGNERQRLTNVGSIRVWGHFFFSTSNLSLAELAQAAGEAVGEAEFGRLADIPCPKTDFGIYEDLHGHDNGAALTDALKSRCRSYFGTPSREFVRQLVAEKAKDVDALRQFLRERRKGYLSKIQSVAERQGLRLLNRVSGRFATVYAAGCLAIRYGIFNWTRKELLQAILSCHLDCARQLKDASQGSSSSLQSPRQKLIAYLTDRQAEFLDVSANPPDREEHEFGSVPGYVASYKGKKWYYLTSDQLKALVGGKANVAALAQALAAEGLMDKSPTKWVVQRRIFGGKGNKGFCRVHAFRAAILKPEAAG
jgi:uncharacterized protein (DUF927 family)